MNKTIAALVFLLPSCIAQSPEVSLDALGARDREFCDGYCDGADGAVVEVRGTARVSGGRVTDRTVECVCATIDPD